MRTTITSLAFLLFISCFAQYSNPYRVAFDGSSYFITNQGNGTVTKLTNGATSTVISGLGTPNDIFFGSIGTNSAILVLDSNKLKLFSPSTYASLINIDISLATEAHDGVVNPNNSNQFFITDRAGNQIIRGNVGPAPFYPITFTTFASGLSKPAGIIVNDDGDLIVVSDTANGSIYKVDASTGAVSIAATTSIDNHNDIAQDNQGNYYLTNWGDDKLYRFDENLSNPVAITTHNKPAGLYSNLTGDFLVMACYGCGNVEFKNYHLFAPNSDVFTCKSDSFFADFSPLYNGIGTYGSANAFQVEISDANGNFSTNPTVIASVSSTTPPASIKTILPTGNYTSFGYKYRLSSTSPPITSFLDKQLNVFNSPIADIASLDTLALCSGGSALLGQANVAGNTYTWSPANMLTDTTLAQVTFTPTSTGYFPINLHISNTQGCTASDSLIIHVAPNLSIAGLADSISICIGDSVSIGQDNVPYTFTWGGSSDIDDATASNPRFFGSMDALLHLSFSDSAMTCSGTDSVFVAVNEARELIITTQSWEACFKDTLTVDKQQSFYTLEWKLNQTLLSNSSTQMTYYADQVGQSSYTICYTDTANGCSDSVGNQLIVSPQADSVIISYNTTTMTLDATGIGYQGTVSWYVNGSQVHTGPNLDRSNLNEGDEVIARMDVLGPCMTSSEPFTWTTVGIEEAGISFAVYPNPSSGKITVRSGSPIVQISVLNTLGEEVLKTTDASVDLSHLGDGVYTLKLATDEGIGTKIVVLQ